MKKLLCTKKVHFTFNDKTYMQVDGVAMGSPLGTVLADIFMIDLEKAVLPELQNVSNTGRGMLIIRLPL